MATDNSTSGGSGCVGFFVVGLFLLFLGLKLGEVGVVASWSWWWVTAPLWIYASLIVVVLLLVFAAFLIVAAFGKLKS